MLDRIISEVLNLKWLIISFIVIGIILYLLVFFSTRSFKWDDKKVYFFSMLYGLDTYECIIVGTLITRLFYIIYISIFNNNISVEYLIPLVIMSAIISAFQKDWIGLGTGIVGSIAVYSIVYLESSLKFFYTNVETDVTILLMIIFLTIFSVLFAIFNFISSYNSLIINKNKKKKTIKA